MFVRLLRAIYAPQNVYCIQVDRKAPRKFRSAVKTLAGCFENVFVSSKTRKAASAALTRLQADINCMEDLVHSRFPWKYVINLCGEDFPIKTNKEIIHYIRSKWNNKNITPGVIQPSNTKFKASQSDPESSLTGSVYVSPNEGFKHEPPHNLTVYFGSAYYVLTRKFVDFVLTDIRAKDMLRWSGDLRCPERHYWVTLNRLRGKDRSGIWRSVHSAHSAPSPQHCECWPPRRAPTRMHRRVSGFRVLKSVDRVMLPHQHGCV